MRASIALLASLLAAVTLAGCSGGDTVSLESVAQAASRTESAGSSRMALVMSMEADGKRFEVFAEGAFDYKRARGWMDMDLGALGALGAGPDLGGPVRMLVEGNTVWMRVPPSMLPQTGGKPWARMSAGSSTLGAGTQQPDPSSMLDSLRGVTDSLEKKGRVSVRGVPTTHYHAKLDMAKAFGEVPAAEREQAEAMLKLFGGSVDVPVDVYIDDADRIRRMELKYEFNLFDQRMAIELKMELFDFGTRVVFTRPSETQIADVSSLTQWIRPRRQRARSSPPGSGS
jgi:hypothetical protein